MVKKIPSMARTGTTAKTTPQVNEAEANKLRSTNGWPPGWRVKRRSQAKNPTNNTRPTNHQGQGADVAPPVLAGLDQPVGNGDQAGGRGRHPDQVQARALGLADSGIRATTAARPSAITGTLSRNTQPHQ